MQESQTAEAELLRKPRDCPGAEHLLSRARPLRGGTEGARDGVLTKCLSVVFLPAPCPRLTEI